MAYCSTSSTMTAAPATKKGRRFSLIRIFNNNHNNHNSNNSGNGSDASSNSSLEASSPSMNRTRYRYSMNPSMDTMKTNIMHERRKSIATVTESSLRSISLRPSAIRPILSRKQAPQVEMTEKMRQFDELLQTRRTTIRISLTPSLLQES
ncbi:hypothetical protein BGZ58_005537 [Dissophora ornata]|nr:hypothetical protein BGZ58_005537 [Dissophora ornata]